MKQWLYSCGRSLKYNSRIVRWAFKLHLMRWSSYRFDAICWIVAIWLTGIIHSLFIYSAYQENGTQIFGYSGQDLLVYFGLMLIINGLAQSAIAGVSMHLARNVWQGQFDFWLLQPPSVFFRILLEDLGIIWYWPNLCIGFLILSVAIKFEEVLLAIMIIFLGAIIEICFMICFCIPAIKWGKWNPEEGLWEYMESARSIPIYRSKNYLLWIASAGVIQYSLALEAFVGGIPMYTYVSISIIFLVFTIMVFKFFIKNYLSASS